MGEASVAAGVEQGRAFAALFPAAPQDGLVQVLAPMVRVSNLALRILSLEQGATVAYSEELVAKKLAQCTRVENPRLGTVEFYADHQKHFCLFQTCAAEKGRIVLQLGVASVEDAVAAARVVAGDVAAIDINMGCPKTFSISGGMGAAMLSKPDDAAAIIRALKNEVSIPVTAKIRMLKTREETVAFMHTLVAAGVDAIAVHCRHVPQRSSTPAHWDELRHLVQAVPVPVLGNGDVVSRASAEEWQTKSGCAGLMVARGACDNPSCFALDGPSSTPVEMLHAHVRLSCRYEEVFQNMKYLYLRYYNTVVTPGTDFFNDLSIARSRRQLCEVLDSYGASSSSEDAPAGGLPSLVAFYDELVAGRGVKGPMEEAGWGKGAAKHHEYHETMGIFTPEAMVKGVTLGSRAGMEHPCAACSESFASRNALFKHVRTSGCKRPDP